jgi:glycosyltransferase involved in cell wall biosynthesis
VYPHANRTSQPDAIGRQLGQRLKAHYEVVYHDWWERGVIRPEPGDILLGHPHPAPGTIFRRSAKERGWSRVLMMSPYNHGDLRQVAFVDRIIPDCDLYLVITGPYWFESTIDSPCSHWLPKMIHLDMAIDRQHFPSLKNGFGPPGGRRFVYIGSTQYMKNTRYLTQIARRMPGVDFSWVGRGATGIEGLKPLGFLDFDGPEGRAILGSFDFLVTVGTADANPTTILEAMAWGMVPVCTPQSGYVGIPTIINVPLDDPDGAAAVLTRLNTLPEQHLLEMQAENGRLLDLHYNWDRFADQVIAAIESPASPPIGPESLSRRLAFAFYGQLSPFGPLLTSLGRMRRLPGYLLKRGREIGRRVSRGPIEARRP